MTGVLFVCLGNICRSPMAEGVFRRLVLDRGVDDRFEIDSAGTGSWHVGEPPDGRTLRVLADRGIDLRHRARQVKPDDGDRFDWILTMDDANLRETRRRLPTVHHDKIHPVMSIAGGGSVPDPYYGGVDGFVEVYDLLLPVCAAWLDRIMPDGA